MVMVTARAKLILRLLGLVLRLDLEGERAKAKPTSRLLRLVLRLDLEGERAKAKEMEKRRHRWAAMVVRRLLRLRRVRRRRRRGARGNILASSYRFLKIRFHARFAFFSPSLRLSRRLIRRWDIETHLK